jgi:hypothetical protein
MHILRRDSATSLVTLVATDHEKARAILADVVVTH